VCRITQDPDVAIFVFFVPNGVGRVLCQLRNIGNRLLGIAGFINVFDCVIIIWTIRCKFFRSLILLDCGRYGVNFGVCQIDLLIIWI
jgi:hypothetical protein